MRRARRRGSDALARRRWALVGGAAIVIVLAAAIVAITRPVAARPSTGGSAGVQSVTTLRANALKALDVSAADVLAVHRTSSISDGQALNEEIWLSPSEPSPAQPVQRRSVILDASGSPVQDVEVTRDVSTVAGQPVLELTWQDTLGNAKHELWLNARTYLPVKEVYAYPAGSPVLGTIETDYTLLPPSAANLAELSPPVPAGFTNETAPQGSPGT